MNDKRIDIALLILSGFMTFIASTYIISYLILVALCPVFACMIRGNLKPFIIGSIFGASFCLMLLYWMPDAVRTFSGGAPTIAWLLYLISITIGALFYGMIALVTATLMKRSGSPLVQALAAASAWTLGEYLLAFLFKGMPWLYFFFGSDLGRNVYLIQWASIGGEHLLSFAVVFINYLLGYYFARRQWVKLWIPALLTASIFVGGWGLFHWSTRSGNTLPGQVRLTLLCANMPPETTWNEHNGNYLAHQLLRLHKKAVDTRPQIILWTETAIPWMYQPDDDLVKAIIQQTKGRHVTDIIGIDSPYRGNIIQNSAYAIGSDGKVIGRYDKRYLLYFAERPLFSFHLPFLNTRGFYVHPGSSAKPLDLPSGEIGTLICNESMIASAAADLTRNGARILVNISNDGWFGKAPMLRNQHFYAARYRAVENRRDMVVNSNDGISGLIRADGTLYDASREAVGVIKQFNVDRSTGTTPFLKFPWITPLASLMIVCLVFLFKT